MRRVLQVRLLFVLIALSLVPMLAMPFAERLRTEWTKYWEPEPEGFDWAAYAEESHVLVNGIYLCPTDYSSAPVVTEWPPVPAGEAAEPAIEVDAGT